MTVLLAKAIGAFALIAGSSMLLRRKMLMHVLNEILHHRALSYMIGMAELLIGLLIVLMHNSFEGLAAAAVTIVGWMIFLEGIAYVFVPQAVMERVLDWLHTNKTYYFISIAYLLLGIYLVYAGFAA